MAPARPGRHGTVLRWPGRGQSARPRRSRVLPALAGNTVGSLAIAILVAAIALGLPILDRSLPSTRPAGTGPFAVGAGVTVVPPAGASLDVTETRPARTRGSALFVIGPVRYAVVVSPYQGGLDPAASRLRGRITGKPGYQVAADDSPLRTDAGVDGRTGSYDSPGRIGRYAVFVAGSVAVEITASGPEGDLHTVLPSVDASIRSVSFGPAS